MRGKWVCKCCETITQAPVAPHVIDKGLPTTGLLAQVLVAKYLDHLPLYRQEAIFERAGMAIARSTLAQWVGECGVQLQPLVDALAAEMLRHHVLHADETLWSYCTTPFNPIKAVVFDFADSRGGQHVRSFLGLPGTQGKPAWQGKLVTDDFSGYKACFELGVTEVGCMAHYPERCFILRTQPSAASRETQGMGAALRINPAPTDHLGIRAHVVGVYRPHDGRRRQPTAH